MIENPTYALWRRGSTHDIRRKTHMGMGPPGHVHWHVPCYYWRIPGPFLARLI